MDAGDSGGPGAPGWDGASSTELVERARAGDRPALDALFERFRPILRRWAAGRLPRWARDLVDTDDMIQETMMRTFLNLENFVPRHEGAFAAYLRQALNNRIRDEIRKSRIRPARVEIGEHHADRGASPLEEALGSDALERYEGALARLGEEDRDLILARIEMGLSYKEIAAATGKPSPDAARMAVGRALLKLAEDMGHE